MEMVNCNEVMELIMREVSKMSIYKEMELISELMGENIAVNGKIIKCSEWENSVELMGRYL